MKSELKPVEPELWGGGAGASAGERGGAYWLRLHLHSPPEFHITLVLLFL